MQSLLRMCASHCLCLVLYCLVSQGIEPLDPSYLPARPQIAVFRFNLDPSPKPARNACTVRVVFQKILLQWIRKFLWSIQVAEVYSRAKHSPLTPKQDDGRIAKARSEPQPRNMDADSKERAKERGRKPLISTQSDRPARIVPLPAHMRHY
eukprot:747841-Hanusia_phi.AAC.2